MQAIKINFSDVLKIEAGIEHYHIPKYQREYTWNKYNWDVLLNDINENDPNYFIGSIIVVQNKTEFGPGEERIYQVIDGQQRLTTLSILLAAIYSRYNTLLQEIDQSDDELKVEFTIKLNSLRKKLIFKKDNILADELPSCFKDNKKYCFLRVQPSTQNHNLDDYKFILYSIGLIKDAIKPKNWGNRLFSKAYLYFLENIPNDKKELDILLDKINRLIFIHISVGSQSDAFTLFETLNNRGVPLSAIDIIKNSMLAEMEKQHHINIDESYEEWQELLEFIPDFDSQQRFLRQYYNAFKFDENIKHEKITKATRSNIIIIYERLIKKNAKKCFDDLLSKGEIYGSLINPTSISNVSLSKKLIELNRIGAASSYTFLLYLFSLNEIHLGNENLKEKVVDILCKYYFRRNVTDFPNTRDLDAINIDLVEQCQSHILKGEKITYNFIETIILNGRGKPSDAKAFRNSLMDNLFAVNEGMARYALTTLDETSHTREYSPNLWDRNEKGLYVWTIEHVFPQGKNITKDWIDMIANGNKNEASEIQENCVHCLGNLTLSGYNSRLATHSFEKKQTKSSANSLGKPIQIGYKNGLALNKLEFNVDGSIQSLASTGEWKEDHIMARNEVMVDMLLKLFSFSNSEIL